MRKAILFLGIIVLVAGCGGKKEVKAEGMLDTPEAHYKMGKRLLKQHDLQAAKREFLRAIYLDERYAPGYEGLAWVFLEQGDLEGAMKNADKAISLDKDFAPAYVVKGAILRKEGKPKDAIKFFDRALELDQKLEDAYIYKAETYVDMGEYDRAEETYKEGATALPNSMTLNERWEEMQRARRAAAGLPPEFVKIARAPRITRGDLAALFVVELDLEKLLKRQGPPERKRFYSPGTPVMGKKEEAKEPEIPDIRNHWAMNYIKTVVELGIMDLYPDGTFKPDEPITRGNFAVYCTNLLAKVLNDPKLTTRFIGSTSPFPDVPSSHYAFNAVMVMTTRGIMKAKLDGTFGLTDPVSGADALMMLKTLKSQL